MNYRVGQILFVVFRNKTQVIPFRIAEELRRKTLQGDSITYKVECGAEPGKSFDVADIDGEIFDSAGAAREALVKRSSAMIERIVQTASETATKWYGVQASEEHHNDSIVQLVEQERIKDQKIDLDDSEPVVIQLPDGRVAKMKSSIRE